LPQWQRQVAAVEPLHRSSDVPLVAEQLLRFPQPMAQGRRIPRRQVGDEFERIATVLEPDPQGMQRLRIARSLRQQLVRTPPGATNPAQDRRFRHAFEQSEFASGAPRADRLQQPSNPLSRQPAAQLLHGNLPGARQRLDERLLLQLGQRGNDVELAHFAA
jgi:hypothetical protein